MKYLLSFTLALICCAAQAGSSDCTKQEFAGTLACTSPHAAEGLRRDALGAWVACGGSCRVVQYPDKIAIEFQNTTQDIPDARFLHGNQATACLDILPLTYDQFPGRVTLLETNSTGASIRLEAQVAIAEFEVFPDTARLSCDGSRLIAQDVYGNGGVLIFDVDTEAAVTPSDTQDVWVLTSADGSHAVALAEFEVFDGYRVVNLDTGATLELRAVHEIDLPAFGTDNSFALVRMTETSIRTEIYNPESGAMIQSLDEALPLGLPFALVDGKVQSLAKLPQK